MRISRKRYTKNFVIEKTFCDFSECVKWAEINDEEIDNLEIKGGEIYDVDFSDLQLDNAM